MLSRNKPTSVYEKPLSRKLRGYAFDPSLSLRLDTAVINTVMYSIDWEDLEPGPSGEYIEVVDYDPASNAVYGPVNLDDPYVLATDGIDPSESNPQFHQQMVYGVIMTTIKNFELALGRKAMWSPRRIKKKGSPEDNPAYEDEYVPKLRVYPHALREANAYYSPQKMALLFGYFSAYPDDISTQMPGGLVFSCLSHDIVAHETAHALLDGMHSSFTNPTNPDVLAFHEAFSDIVALFQHFTFPEVLKHQIALTKGDLEKQNILGQLAQEFGNAIGHYGALRDAIGEIDKESGQWKLKKSNPQELSSLTEPHARGSILVAAVFEAFLSMYKKRVADLLRLASGGTGILPEGEIGTDLVNRLATEASKTARHVLKMCIRALDYCPPVDITFGEYLRAIITADYDMVGLDPMGYRLAFIEAFRKRGIYPPGIRTLSMDSLLYKPENIDTLSGSFEKLGEFLREFREQVYYCTKREEIYRITGTFIRGGESYGKMNQGLHEKLNQLSEKDSMEFEYLTGLMFSKGWKKLGIRTSNVYGERPSFQVSSLKLVNRAGPTGKIVNQIVMTLIQRSGIRFEVPKKDSTGIQFSTYIADNEPLKENSFEFKGGVTLIFDLDTLELKYCIRKPLLDLFFIHADKRLNMERVQRQYEFMFANDGKDEYSLYFGNSPDNSANEPFTFLHR